MSLFDVIKYPISEHPTEAELAALPANLFSEWKRKAGYLYFTSPWALAVSYKILTSKDQNDIKLLKQMIRDYNEPI